MFSLDRRAAICLREPRNSGVKVKGSCHATPQHPRSVVRSEALCNAFGASEAGLMFYSGTAAAILYINQVSPLNTISPS